ncbi:hypothetical protein BD289DRAFT_446263 [Coniella lustricola]|uniref:MICOS complex subunit MIC12 n=1 Tax=Coniella lustricola TaxID=2025994 RepID=A0A2T2ZU16_9PEZI|nr:hypothetical protein BD289DRAFT_446263 [Coniella lustricola]
MGFTTGFTGGVTLVLGAAYLSLQAHQRTRLSQAESLRANTYILNSLTYIPASAPPPQTVAQELALLEYQQELLLRAQQRRSATSAAGGSTAFVADFVERAKERWNAEVEGAVRWAAHTDWQSAREDAEAAAARVWARFVTGGDPPARTAAKISEHVGSAAAAAQSQLQDAGRQAAEQARIKGVEAKDAAGSVWERGFRRGQAVAAQAKATVGLAEDRVERKIAAVGAAVDAAQVDKVLQQRFEPRHHVVLGRSAEEVLADRYKPVEEVDRSNLRGI